MKSYLSLIVNFIGIVLSQTEDCLYLDANSVCGPDYKGQPVSLMDGKFDSVDDFNVNFAAGFLNDSYVASTYNELFQCNAAEVKSQYPSIRFQRTFWCSFYVNIAVGKGCKPLNDAYPNGIKLCSPRCDVYVRSVDKILKNGAVCPQSTAIDEYLLNFVQFCANNITAPAGTSNCLNGTEAEAKYCGWSSLEIGKKYCSEMKSIDPCCKKLRETVINDSAKAGDAITWWHKLLIGVGSFVLLSLIFFAILNHRKRKAEGSKEDKYEAAEEGVMKTEKDEEIPGMPADELQEKIADSITKKKRPIMRRPTKNFSNITEDLAKERAKADQSINSLMKFFGVGMPKKPPTFVNQQVAFESVNPKAEKEKDSSASASPNPPPIESKTPPATELKTLPANETTTSPPVTSEATPVAALSKRDDSKSFEPIETKTENETKPASAAISDEPKDDTVAYSEKIVVVIQTYEASCPDELSLDIGELVLVKKEFDDGWAVGIEQKSKREGAFPLMCTGKLVSYSKFSA